MFSSSGTKKRTRLCSRAANFKLRFITVYVLSEFRYKRRLPWRTVVKPSTLTKGISNVSMQFDDFNKTECFMQSFVRRADKVGNNRVVTLEKHLLDVHFDMQNLQLLH